MEMPQAISAHTSKRTRGSTRGSTSARRSLAITCPSCAMSAVYGDRLRARPIGGALRWCVSHGGGNGFEYTPLSATEIASAPEARDALTWLRDRCRAALASVESQIARLPRGSKLDDGYEAGAKRRREEDRARDVIGSAQSDDDLARRLVGAYAQSLAQGASLEFIAALPPRVQAMLLEALQETGR